MLWCSLLGWMFCNGPDEEELGQNVSRPGQLGNNQNGLSKPHGISNIQTGMESASTMSRYWVIDPRDTQRGEERPPGRPRFTGSSAAHSK